LSSFPLTGPRLKELCDALLSAFPTRSSLEQMLAFKLEKSLSALVADGGSRK